MSSNGPTAAAARRTSSVTLPTLSASLNTATTTEKRGWSVNLAGVAIGLAPGGEKGSGRITHRRDPGTLSFGPFEPEVARRYERPLRGDSVEKVGACVGKGSLIQSCRGTE